MDLKVDLKVGAACTYLSQSAMCVREELKCLPCTCLQVSPFVPSAVVCVCVYVCVCVCRR